MRVSWLSPFITHAFAFDVQSYAVSLLRAADLIKLLLFSEENIKAGKAKPLK